MHQMQYYYFTGKGCEKMRQILTNFSQTFAFQHQAKSQCHGTLSAEFQSFLGAFQGGLPVWMFGGWWCSGILSGLLRRRSGVQIPDPPTLEKCAEGICLCNLLRSTQPNDRETMIEG